MESIAHTVWSFFVQHVACISVTTAMGIWTALNTWRHSRIDGKIMRAIHETGMPLRADAIGQRIHARTAKVESRLWDLLDREKVSQNTATGVRLWGAPDARASHKRG